MTLPLAYNYLEAGRKTPTCRRCKLGNVNNKIPFKDTDNDIKFWKCIKHTQRKTFKIFCLEKENMKNKKRPRYYGFVKS